MNTMDLNLKKTYAGIIMLLMMLGFVVLVPPTRAQFVIAEWNYPDEYGQGISGLKCWENSTGSWVGAPYYTHYYPDYHEELGAFYYLNYYQVSYFYNWSAGVAIKIRVDTLFNATLTGAEDLADGQNFQQHNVTVTHLGSVIFSQQNFTYVDSSDVTDPMYYYEYSVILNFLPEYGEIYTVTITYEVFY